MSPCGIYVKILKDENLVLVAQNQTLTTKLQVSNNSITVLQKSINDQNTSIQSLKTDAVNQLIENQIALNKANQDAQSYMNQAMIILNKKENTNISSCQSANDLINQEIKNEIH